MVRSAALREILPILYGLLVLVFILGGPVMVAEMAWQSGGPID